MQRLRRVRESVGVLRVIGRNRHVVDSFRSCQYGRGESWLSFEEASWGGDTRVDAESDEVKNVGENSNVVKNRRLGTSDPVRAASRHAGAYNPRLPQESRWPPR